MTGSIHFRCPACRAKIKAPAQLIGQTRSCPHCTNQVTIEPTAPDDAGPVLAADEAPVQSRWRGANTY